MMDLRRGCGNLPLGSTRDGGRGGRTIWSETCVNNELVKVRGFWNVTV